MYRRKRSSPLSTIIQTILLGVIIGLIFFVTDNKHPVHSGAPVEEAAPAARVSPALSTPPAARADALPAPNSTSVFIPTAGIRTDVIETYLDGTGWDISNLGMNAGHLQGTAWLNKPGNIVLAGHVELADGRAGVFANIGALKVGDPIVLTHGSDERHYVVTQLETVAPDDLSALYPTSTDQLTLVTCSNYNFLQDAYLERVVVVAQRIA